MRSCSSRRASRSSRSRAVPRRSVPLVSGGFCRRRDDGDEAPARARPRTVWHIAGPLDWIEAGQRTVGWERALREARDRATGAPLTGDWSPASGYEVGRQLAARPRRDGGVRRQRPDGPRAPASSARGRSIGASGCRRGRLRRRARGRVLHASAHARSDRTSSRSDGWASICCSTRSRATRPRASG